MMKYLAAYVALIWCLVLATKSMASSSAYRWFKNKGDGLGANRTGPNHQYSESGSPRAIVQSTNPCYTQYFVGQQPPTGFRPNSPYIKHICQQIYDYSDDTLYATMFDANTGIAVYAAYGLPHDQVPLLGTFPRIQKWIQNPGLDNVRQGNNQMYKNNAQDIQKGHLVPASTYSFDCIYMVSTFRYTNAVPQYKSFNEGIWKVYEDRVRLFAANVCYPAGGDLYLLTGTSEAVVSALAAAKRNLTYFPYNNPTSGENIVIPNSIWTAGCCILRNGGIVGGFAAIGNNVQVNPEMHQKKVAELQDILAIGIGGVGAKIHLFPGNEGCSKNLQQFRYEEGGTHPGWTKVIKLK